MASCDQEHENTQSVTLPADEIFRVLRVRTDFYKQRQDFHSLLCGASGFTDHTKILGAGVRYAGEETALAIQAGSNPPAQVNVTENFAFSMYWTDPECTHSRLAFQISGARPTHTAQGKIASGPAPRQLFIGIELDATMHNATIREIRMNGKTVPVTPQTVKRLLNAISLSMDSMLANGRIDFAEHLHDTLPERSIQHRRARMARRKSGPNLP